MATFSTHALEAMGFRDLVEKSSIVASFSSLTVYEIRGIAFPENFVCARQANVAGATYQIAFSSRINAGSQCLLGEDFAESGSDWLKEVKSNGPFALVAVGPTEFIECEAGRMIRMPDGSITTYDSFPSIREILNSLEARILPAVVTTVTLTLSGPERYVALRKLDKACVGTTRDGILVHDVRIEVRGELTATKALDASQSIDALATVVKRAPKLHQRAAKFFALGAAEIDELKRFLYFFLSLEVETHAAFGHIDHAQMLRSRVLRDEVGLQYPTAIELLTREIADWHRLLDRFVWCATCAWSSVTDDDVKLFKQLKSARDAIAHGKASEPPVGFARKAELLAHRVLWGGLQARSSRADPVDPSAALGD